MQVPFAQVLGPFAQKKAPGEVDLLGGLGIYCIFLPKFMVYLFCGLARPFYGKGVSTMSPFLSLIQSVAVNIISHCVCKWLDGWLKGRKH